MDKKELGQIRREYDSGRLEETHLPENPLELFDKWLHQAQSSDLSDPNAMNLSTVNPDGQPSSRIVLLKKIQDGKLIFYTNYHSRKSSEIKTQAKVAAHFYWPELERQVIIAGTARPVEDEDADQYFRSRPFESNIAAWASPQSEVIPHRQYLVNAYEKYLKKYKTTDQVPRPPFWGGYAITPGRIEFWQGGLHRLHDRIEYSLREEGWSRVRLAP